MGYKIYKPRVIMTCERYFKYEVVIKQGSSKKYQAAYWDFVLVLV